MTVCAEKHAFVNFFFDLFPAPCVPSRRDSESFLCLVKMMKLQELLGICHTHKADTDSLCRLSAFRRTDLPALLDSRNQVASSVSVFPRIIDPLRPTAACSTIELSRNLHSYHAQPLNSRPHVEGPRSVAQIPPERDSTIELSRNLHSYHCTTPQH